MTSFNDFYQRSLEDREAFWAEQAGLIDWHEPFTQVCDHTNPPFSRWFVGGKTNLCHNAVDQCFDRGLLQFPCRTDVLYHLPCETRIGRPKDDRVEMSYDHITVAE